jgi:hypothetical protein
MICQPKDQGGLGVQNIEIQNKCLWQTIIRKKYLANQTIGKTQKKLRVSHFWAGLMEAKPDCLRFGSFHLNNGEQIRFWKDKWLGNYSFQQQYPSLPNILRKKSDTVAQVLSTIPLNISFGRFLTGNNLVLWNGLILRVMNIQLNDNADAFRWNLHQNGLYYVHSLYMALINNGMVETNKIVWKIKIPLKIKIFMWYMQKGVVLMKDNLTRRNWKGNKQCCFCMKNESI